MILNRVYYLIKPLLPWRFRMVLRRQRADRKREACAATWPIDELAGATPPNWPGWPEGKQFAVVLTHDVEGTKGLQRVPQLMDVERKFGFRSSFNFVPKGEYRVPADILQTMEQRGFEVAVHGLEHDGKLYRSKSHFIRKAAGIREYLRDWKASGFRSPLMQHRLDWLHRLGVEYDASTFDTDPFEPEPDGVRTIFPFWVPGKGESGYVELPYTLVQDFTLFVILGEPNIDIWKKKVEWIAAHGGMVLLNVHPDYIAFSGTTGRDEFPVSHYEELLSYLNTRYAGQFWHALPKDVARYYRSSLPVSKRNTRRRICMVTHSIYESDGRVRRYAETLQQRGDHVEVLALAKRPDQPKTDTVNGVILHRLQLRKRDEKSKWAYVSQLATFLASSTRHLTRRYHSDRFDLIHVHNMPDFLTFSAWFPKLNGAKVILDIHDVVPELFANKFPSRLRSAYRVALEFQEKASAALADHVIIANDLWRERVVRRSVPSGRCSVVLNHVDPAIFFRRVRTRATGAIVVIFPGTFQWHQGLDIGMRAFARIKEHYPDAEFHLYGGGGGKHAQAELAALADQLGLAGSVKFSGLVALDEIPKIIANADLGIVPKRADSFGNEAYSTKIMEFMSQGIPVIASRTKIDSFYFDDSTVKFFPSGDDAAMAEAMLEVLQNHDLRARLIANGLDYAQCNSWDSKKKDYLDLVDSLLYERFGDSASEVQYLRNTDPAPLAEDAARPATEVRN